MNILVDIGHPAHVHYFRNVINQLREKHSIIVTAKNSPIIKYLLEAYNIPYINLGDKGDSLFDKVFKQVSFVGKVAKIIRDKKVDLAMGVSISIAQAAKLCGIYSVYFDDDDLKASPLTAMAGTPFASVVLSPDCLKFENTRNALYYPGYHELAYLHPKVYQPNLDTLTKYGLDSKSIFYILRFNAFKAHHDVKEGGMSLEQKRRLIKLLSPSGRVFISTEEKIDKEFEKYKMPISPEDIHDMLFHARMLVSDSQTMSSEAAVLGTPSFRCNSFSGRISYLEEEEKRYGLTYGYLPHQFDWMLDKIKENLLNCDIKVDMRLKRDILLSEKINVTAFWLWFIENYPDSISLIKSGKVKFNEFM